MTKLEIGLTVSFLSILCIPIFLIFFTGRICVEQKQVVELGQCLQYASCKVKFHDGTYGKIGPSIIGEWVCTKNELRIK